jgi:DNA primase
MDAVEDIKQRLGIEEVIGDYVELKRAGRNWKGLSPFGSERTPSFMVSPDKQIWHDFSSGKGGDMFSFVMEMEGLDFKGALELLARKAGIDLDLYRNTGAGSRAKDKERLYDALELATKFYQTQLKNNRTALAYIIDKRHFSKATIIEWRLGYSPNTGSALVEFLLSKKFTEQEIRAAGLIAQRYKGVGDMFRGRIMIPLADAQGRIIGFTARLLDDNPDAPKYINTPQTLLYDKSRHVFGLHLAKEAIRKNNYAVVAEGNLDVITSHQAGIRQVVATAGTALTEAHLKVIARLTSDIRLSFDADQAGVKATERAIPIASRVDINLSIVTISSGKDPDELIRQDVGAWQSAVSHPTYAADWLIERYQKQLDITSAQGKREFSDIVMKVVKELSDKVEQEHYVGLLAGLIGVSRDALLPKLRENAEPARRLKKPAALSSPSAELNDYRRTQNHLLAVVLMQSELRSLLRGITKDMFLGKRAQALFNFLLTHQDFVGDPTQVSELLPVEDYVKILVLHYEELYQATEPYELKYEAIRLRANLISQYVRVQKQHIKRELQTATDGEQKKILQRAKELDYLLRTYRGGV